MTIYALSPGPAWRWLDGDVDEDGRVIGERAVVAGGPRARDGRGDRGDDAPREPVEAGGHAAVPGAEQAHEQPREQPAHQLLRAGEDVGIRQIVEVRAGGAVVEPIDREVARAQQIEDRPFVALLRRQVLVDGGAKPG